MDLNKLSKDFGDLDPKAKKELLCAWVDGEIIEQWSYMQQEWFRVGKPTWKIGFPYRVAVIRPSINWDHVSDKYNYLAVDECGGIFLYKERPSIALSGSLMWQSSGGHQSIKDTFASYTGGSCGWKDSLICRRAYD